jgi:hypothetical protein
MRWRSRERWNRWRLRTPCEPLPAPTTSAAPHARNAAAGGHGCGARWPISACSPSRSQKNGAASAAMLEQAGAELVPGPLISTAIGAVLCADAAVPQEISMEICAGQRPVGIAGAHTGAVVYAGADGHLHISGTFASVDGAGPGALLILPGRTDTTRVWVLVEPHHGGLTITPLPGIDFAAPMAQVECRDVPVTAVLGSAYRAIDDLYITAVAAVCAPRCFVALSKPVRWPRMRRPWMPTNGRWPPPQRPPSPSTPRSTTPKTVSRCSAPSDSPGNTTLSCT